MKYRLTQYSNELGNIYWKVERKTLLGWVRIQRPLELSHGMTDPFSRDEALRLVEKDSGSRRAILSQEEITV